MSNMQQNGQLTRGIYAHLVEDSHREAVEKLAPNLFPIVPIPEVNSKWQRRMVNSVSPGVRDPDVGLFSNQGGRPLRSCNTMTTLEINYIHLGFTNQGSSRANCGKSFHWF
jgi:hypothetical protein